MIELTHVGETVVAQMVNRSPAVRRLLADRLGSAVPLSPGALAVRELRLSTCGRYSFDGNHKIDVAILDKASKACIPCEAKLGLTLLSGPAFEDRFLKKCGTSHGDRRITGKMTAILERKLPNPCSGLPILVVHEGTDYELTPRWLLIAREQVLAAWRSKGRPALSERCAALSVEEVVEAYGGHAEFNSLVRELLEFDYHSTWLGDM